MQCITSAEEKHLAEQTDGASDASIASGNAVGNSLAPDANALRQKSG
jgi:hypothetical protein